MFLGMQAARFASGEVPDCYNLPAAAGETFLKGRILTRVGATVQRHAGGTVVTGVYGVSQSGATNGVGLAMNKTVNVAKASRATEFLGQLYNAGTGLVVTANLATHIGQKYGFITVNGVDYVDVSETTSLIMEITDVKVNLNMVLFKFLETVIQAA